MKKYKRKPTPLNAFQIFASASPEWPEWFNQAWENEVVFVNAGVLCIRTLEGDMRVTDGDYIVQGVKNELWPVKEEIFNLTYEEIEC